MIQQDTILIFCTSHLAGADAGGIDKLVIDFVDASPQHNHLTGGNFNARQ